MNSKNYAIEKMEELIKNEEEQLEKYKRNIKTFTDECDILEELVEQTVSNIASMKDALHKLKGLDNLEKKNKVADPVSITIPSGFVVKNVTGLDIHKFARDLILPEIIKLLKDRQYTFHEQLKEALK